MSTRDEIIRLGFDLVRDKGFNAFSFSDIAQALHIKNSSVHYYFPTKTDLGVAVVRDNIARLDALEKETSTQSPQNKLKAFLSIYTDTKAGNKVCLVGSLATDLHTVEEPLRDELKILVDKILKWVTKILAEGRTHGVFHFTGTPRTRALMIITNMLASVQLTRLTGDRDFNTIKDNILKELKHE